MKPRSFMLLVEEILTPSAMKLALTFYPVSPLITIIWVLRQLTFMPIAVNSSMTLSMKGLIMAAGISSRGVLAVMWRMSTVSTRLVSSTYFNNNRIALT